MSKSKKAMVLKAFTEDVGHNMQLFKEGTELMVRKHQKSNIKTSSFAITLKEMSEREGCRAIKDALDKLSKKVDESEQHRQVILGQLQANIVDQFQKYPAKLKVQQANIKARNSAVEAYSSKWKAYQDAKKSGDAKKLHLASEMLAEEQKRMRSAEDTLNASLGQFELERVVDMKSYLKRYIQSQMYYFSRCLEGLSEAYEAVLKIEPEAERAAWLRELKKLEVDEVENTAMLSTSNANTQLQQSQAVAVANAAAAPAAAAAAPAPVPVNAPAPV